jgi:hypothetical protein
MRKVLAVILFSSLAIVMSAQTGISVSTGTSALAVHKNGGWGVASMTYAAVPVWSTAADANGNVNMIAARADAFMPSSAMGFNYYGVGGTFTPTKWLTSVLSKTLIPSDSLQFGLHASVGSYVPTIGAARPSGLFGVTASAALNQSGSVVWNVVEAGWLNPGVTYVSSGLRYYFNSPQTSASAKSLRRVRRSLY